MASQGEPLLEVAAAPEGPQLLAHEVGQAGARELEPGDKARQVLADDARGVALVSAPGCVARARRGAAHVGLRCGRRARTRRAEFRSLVPVPTRGLARGLATSTRGPDASSAVRRRIEKRSLAVARRMLGAQVSP